MSTERILRLARAAGAEVDDVVAGEKIDTVPAGPSGQWVLVPHGDGSTTLGGLDRGRFRSYGRYETDELAANAVAHVHQPMDTVHIGTGDLAVLSADASALAAQLRDTSTLHASDLPVGVAIDHIGSISGHVAFLLDTPFSERSAPPTDLNLVRRRFVLRAPLAPDVTLEVMQPWFGQPGGGIAIWLAHPLRWYYDTGIVDVVTPTTTSGS